MVTGIARRTCPHCCSKIMVVKHTAEPYLCPTCLGFFLPAVPVRVPVWVWGVLAMLCCLLLL